jgi:hypothetical protein
MQAESGVALKLVPFFIFIWLGLGLFVGSTNQIHYVLHHDVSSTLLEERTFVVTNQEIETDIAYVNGTTLPNRHPGLFIFGAAAYALVKPFAGNFDFGLAWTGAWMSFFTSTAAVALVATLVALASLRLGLALPGSMLVGAGTVVSTTLLPYSSVLHHDVLITLFILIHALWLAGLLWKRRWALPAGLFGGLVITTSGLGALAMPGLALGAFIRHRARPAVLAQYLIGLGAGLLPVLLYNLRYGGGIFSFPYLITESHTNYPILTLERILHNLKFYTMSAEGSWLLYSPLTLIGVIGLVARKELRRPVLSPALLVFGPLFLYILTMESIGWCQYGPRFLMPFIPVFALGAAGVMQRLGAKGVVAVALASLAGLIVNLPALLTTVMQCTSGYSPLLTWPDVFYGRTPLFPLLKPTGITLLIIAVAFILLRKTSRNRVFILPLLTLFCLAVFAFTLKPKAGEYDIKAYERMAANALSDPAPHNALGSLYMKLGRREEAAVEFEAALKLSPYRAEGYYNLGLIRLELGDYQGAVAAFIAGRNLFDKLGQPRDYSDSSVNIANAYLRLGMFDEAVAEYSIAVEADPTNELARQNLARLLAMSGR